MRDVHMCDPHDTLMLKLPVGTCSQPHVCAILASRDAPQTAATLFASIMVQFQNDSNVFLCPLELWICILAVCSASFHKKQ